MWWSEACASAPPDLCARIPELLREVIAADRYPLSPPVGMVRCHRSYLEMQPGRMPRGSPARLAILQGSRVPAGGLGRPKTAPALCPDPRQRVNRINL